MSAKEPKESPPRVERSSHNVDITSNLIYFVCCEGSIINVLVFLVCPTNVYNVRFKAKKSFGDVFAVTPFKGRVQYKTIFYRKIA
jgi:hypothetical protein